MGIPVPLCPCGEMLLELFVKFAGRARNENSAGDITLAVFHALHDASRLAALGAVGTLGRVHHFLAVCGLGDLCHGSPWN
jgi:hypothetical protein